MTSNTPYLLFSSNSTSFTLSITRDDTFDGTLEYSFDNVTYSPIVLGETYTNSRIYVRGSGNTTFDNNDITAKVGESLFALTSDDPDNLSVNLFGELLALNDYESVSKGIEPPIDAFCYNSLFRGHTCIKSCPKMSATNLPDRCYNACFKDSGVTYGPYLPATDLSASGIYWSMFDGCADLLTPPSFPTITSVGSTCFFIMLRNCTKLKVNTSSSNGYAKPWSINTVANAPVGGSHNLNTLSGTAGTATTLTLNTTYYIKSSYRLFGRCSGSKSSVIGGTLNQSNGLMTWTDDIAGLNEFDAYTTSTDGNYVSVVGLLDNYFPYNQLKEVTDNEGNVFIQIPKFYLSLKEGSFKIANYQVDSSYIIPDCFLNPNMSGKYNNYVLLGKYEATGSTSKIYSKTSVSCLGSITRAAFRSAARAYGTLDNYYNGYQNIDFSMWEMFNLLCMLYYRTINIQKVYSGRTSSSSASATGTCDGVKGFNGWNTTSTCVKMLGIENPYGNMYAFIDGIYFNGTTAYIHQYPTNFIDGSTNATYTATRPNKYIYVGALNPFEGQYVMVGEASSGGSTSTYYGDRAWHGGNVLLGGGRYSTSRDAGLWCWAGDIATSGTRGDFGARLCKRQI